MNAAQVALAVLTIALVAAGTVLTVFDHAGWGTVLLVAALFGFLVHLAMVVNDSRVPDGDRG